MPSIKTIEEMQELVRPNIEEFYHLRDSQSIHKLQELSTVIVAQMFTVNQIWSYWNDQSLTIESIAKNDTARKFLENKVRDQNGKTVSDKIAEMRARVELSGRWNELVIAKANAAAAKALHDDMNEAVYSIRQRVSVLGKERDTLNGQ